MASDTVEIKPPGLIKDIAGWRSYLASNWQTQQQELRQFKFENEYQFLLAMSFSPVLPTSKTALLRLVSILQKLRFCVPLAQAIQKIYSCEDYTIGLRDFVQKYLLQREANGKKQEALDWLLLSLDVVQVAL